MPTATTSQSHLSPADAARIRARYPRSRMRSPLGLLLIGVIAGLLLLWTIWAGLKDAAKPVDSQVHSFSAASDTLVHVTIDVQRRDTTKGASCLVVAAGQNGIAVGQATASVAAGGQRMTTSEVDIRTTGRALSANVATCSVS